MRRLILFSCSLLLCTGLCLAQGKIDSQWNCAKPADSHSINVEDETGHAYSIAQISCTAAKGEIEGLPEKTGVATEFDEVKGNTVHLHGVFVETLSNGDKVHVNYQGKSMLDKGQMQSAENTWTIAGGTGKMKGAKGKGGCKAKGNADGSTTFDCSGEYTLAK